MFAWIPQLLGLVIVYLIAQQVFVLLFLATRRVPIALHETPRRALPGKRIEQITEHDDYTVIHSVEDGIERIIYRPRQAKFKTPIVMQHGMWHGAWCWERWQRLLALQGWETHAHSLPGHALSPTQRPIPFCTLDYYLSFLKHEIDRCQRKPVLMGHSMGGALTQWYLKHVGDDLPAAVLVSPWVSHSTLAYADEIIRLDPVGVLLLPLVQWSASSWVRSPQWAAQKLLGPQPDITPEALHAHLGPESILVVMQHNPPFWSPPQDVRTPMLLAAGELDTVCPLPHLRQTAEHYGAEFIHIPRAGHNLMMDGDYAGTAGQIHEWLVRQNIE